MKKCGLFVLPIALAGFNAFGPPPATQCAHEQGAFWPFREQIRLNPNDRELDALVQYATRTNMDVARFRLCMESNQYIDRIRAAVKDYVDRGLQGTPSFLIGKNDPA